MNRRTKVVTFYQEMVWNKEESKENFTFRNDRKHHLLQKMCIFILKKIGAFAINNKGEYKRIEIDSDRVIQKIIESKCAVDQLDRFFDEKKVILIGSEDLHQMIGQEVNKMTHFHAQYNHSREGIMTVVGMDCIVVPWMSGVLVVPERMLRYAA